jgi:ferrous iron transport protein A
MSTISTTVQGVFKGAALKLLRVGQRGVITAINTRQDLTAQTLKRMGLQPGSTVTVEECFPRFKVRVGANCFALDYTAINVIQVRPLGNFLG